MNGCAGLVVRQMATPLRQTLEDTTDLQLLADGLPSLLLLHDSLRARYPGNIDILRDGVRAWGSYSQLLAAMDRQEPSVRAAARADDYATALLGALLGIDQAEKLSTAALERRLEGLDGSRAEDLFWSAFGQAVRIRASQGEPAAMARLPRVKLLMERVITLDESCCFAGAHLFLGAWYGSLPRMLGGNPEKSRVHFERALAITARRYLMAQVLFAESYARQTMDRQLYVSLLAEVLAAADDPPGAGAANAVARLKARRLLDATDEYFD